MTRRHCVRCHVEYDPASPGGCRVRAGRDTDTRAVGERAVTVCLQCEHEHRVDTRPFCFQGEHTSNAALANWGVSDASDPLDFPAPEAPTCTQCGGEVWGEAAPAEAQAEGHPGAATQSLATAFRRYKALAAQYDEASWGVLEPEEQARLVAEARGAARQAQTAEMSAPSHMPSLDPTEVPTPSSSLDPTAGNARTQSTAEEGGSKEAGLPMFDGVLGRFVLIVDKATPPVPLRATHQLDGCGQSGCVIYFSDHAGASALEPWVIKMFGEKDPSKGWTAKNLALNADLHWCIATSPTGMHPDHARDGPGLGEACFNTEKCPKEYEALVNAGIVTATGRTFQLGFYPPFPIAKINLPAFMNNDENEQVPVPWIPVPSSGGGGRDVKAGTRVRVQGLVKAAQYNGKDGKVRQILEGGRIRIALDDGSDLGVKLQNLQIL
eukprot:Tamp_14691.p1 GENE.Tamp_14691~~Tamp_14691.p1  ORF type:complete len:437 (-),score=70.80 Tamp_14691:298-1608(-)